MRNVASILIIAIALTSVEVVAQTIQPVYTGKYGNPEEPATRPYKWLWRGVKALTFHPVQAFKDGNRKSPFLGTSETFRGLRKGMVEFDESIVRGAMFAIPPQAGDYKLDHKRLLKANTIIENDPLLRNTADFLTMTTITSAASGAASLTPSFSKSLTGPAYGWKSDMGAAKLAVLTFVALKHTDRRPLNSETVQDDIAESNARWKIKRKAQLKANIDQDESDVRRAQRRYVGGRIRMDRKIKGGGNLLKLAH